MNPLEAENDFRQGIEKLLSGVDNQFQRDSANPNAVVRDESIHEHNTRIYFFDRLLQLLGWDLGLGGNVTQEARIKADTTKFIDYVGINQNTRAPVLIFEAKAWDKPIIKGRGEKVSWPKINLVIAAVKHVNEGGDKNDSPVTTEWHNHLSQLSGYVCDCKKENGHSVSRVVLSSGQWLLVFTDPVSTFINSQVNDQQFHLFERDEYINKAHTIFQLLARVYVSPSVPFPIRSSKLKNYVNEEGFIAVYHGMLIRYEASGTHLFTPQPKILVYPSVIVQRKDGILITVIDSEEQITMEVARAKNGGVSLGTHLVAVKTLAKELLQSCSTELGFTLIPSDLADFPGFPTDRLMFEGGPALGATRKQFVKTIRTASDEWLVVTGSHTHYLLKQPQVKCKFHTWTNCNTIGKSIGKNAINSPSTKNPRSFFIDGHPHHCAHQTVNDKRDDRCYIQVVDSRICCNTCIYHESCWMPDEAHKLPCGN